MAWRTQLPVTSLQPCYICAWSVQPDTTITYIVISCRSEERQQHHWWHTWSIFHLFNITANLRYLKSFKLVWSASCEAWARTTTKQVMRSSLILAWWTAVFSNLSANTFLQLVALDWPPSSWAHPFFMLLYLCIRLASIAWHHNVTHEALDNFLKQGIPFCFSLSKGHHIC